MTQQRGGAGTYFLAGKVAGSTDDAAQGIVVSGGRIEQLLAPGEDPPSGAQVIVPDQVLISARASPRNKPALSVGYEERPEHKAARERRTWTITGFPCNVTVPPVRG